MISNRFNAETKYLILETLVAVYTHTHTSNSINRKKYMNNIKANVYFR